MGLNSFFRVCIWFCLALIVFTLVINLTEITEAFGPEEHYGVQDVNADNALSQLTKLDDPNMNAVFVLCSGIGAASAIGLAILTHSFTPVGIYLFGQIFWTSFIRAWSVMGLSGGYVSAEVTGIFFIGAIFIFLAAVIGMITGSG